MLLVIHNLPSSSRYSDVKTLLQNNCGLSELILDNLVNEGLGKKVTVGVADAGDAAILVRKINGLYIGGQQLFVENAKQQKSDQPYRPTKGLETYQKETKSTDYLNQSQGWSQNQHTGSNMAAQNMYMAGQNMLADPTSGMMMGYGVQMPAVPYYQMPTMGMGMPMQQESQNNLMHCGGQQEPDRNTVMPQEPVMRGQVEHSRDYTQGRQSKVQQSSSGSARNWSGNSQSPVQERSQATRPERLSRPDYPNSNLGQRGRSRSPQQPTPSWNSREPFYMQQQPADTNTSQYGSRRDQKRDSGSNFGQERSGWSANSSGRSDSARGRSDSRAQGRSDSDAYGYREPRSRGSNRSPNAYDPGDPTRVSRWNRDEPKALENPKSFASSGDRSWRSDDVAYPFTGSKRSQDAPKQFQSASGDRAPKHYSDRSNDYEEPRAKRFAGSDYGNRNQGSFSQRAPPAKDWQQRPSAQTQPYSRNKDKPWEPRQSGSFKAPPPQKNKKVVSKNQLIKEQKAKDMVTIMNRDQTWRGQATAAIAKQILERSPKEDTKTEVVKKLKNIIKSRIEVLLGDEIGVPLQDIIDRYRKRYPTDEDETFFIAVLDNLKTEEAESRKNGNSDKNNASTPAGTQPKDGAPRKPTQPAKQQGKPAPKQPPSAQLPKVKFNKANAEEWPLRYEDACKAKSSEQKHQQRMEMENENLYELPPHLAKALDAECDTLCDLFMGECQVPDDESDKQLCERISDHVSDVFRKLVKLNVTKRILNVTSGLQVRICSSYKNPGNEALTKFLEPLGVIHIKKSTRTKGPLHVAQCGSFESYDRLCAMETAVIGGVQVTIKPFHVTGPAPRYDRKKKPGSIKQIDRDIYKQPAPGEQDSKDDDYCDNDEDDDADGDEPDEGDDGDYDDYDNGDDINEGDEHGDNGTCAQDVAGDDDDKTEFNVDDIGEDDLEDY